MEIDDSLQKAAREYLSDHRRDDIKNGIDLTILDAFKAGAQWKEKEMQSTINEVIKEYIDKGEKCYKASLGEKEELYWDGFKDCAVGIMGEMQKDNTLY